MPGENNNTSAGISILSLRDLYRVIFKHLETAITCFLLMSALIAALVLVRDNVFSSDAKLLVRIDPAVDPISFRSDTERKAQLHSELEILTSNELLNEVSDLLATGEHPSGPIQIDADDIESQLSPGLQDESNVINLTFSGQEAEFAQRVLLVLVERYLDKHIEIHQNTGAYEFFLQETERLEGEIEDVEDSLFKLKSEMGVTSIEQERTALLDRIDTLEQSRQQAIVAVASTEARITRLEELAGDIPQKVIVSESSGAEDGTLKALQQRLYELRISEQDLLIDYLDESRPVQEVRTRIQTTEKMIANVQSGPRVVRGINPNLQQATMGLVEARALLSSQKAQADALETQVGSVRDELKQLSANEAELNRLTRNVQTQAESYRSYQESLEQARIQRAFHRERISNISVIQRATLPDKPIGPGKVPLLALGLFMALGISIMLVFVLEFLSDAVDSPDKLEERVNIRALASIPELEDWKLGQVPRSVSRPFRELREQVTLATQGSGSTTKFVAVTGCQPGAGVTSVAAGLAATLALRGEGDVALVDANFEDPRISDALLGESRPGISDALARRSKAKPPVHPLRTPNMHVIPGGTASHRMLGRFAHDEMMELLREWTASFAYVVIDLPQITSHNSFAALASACDVSFIVLESGKTRWQVAHKTSDVLRMASVNLLGAVLNKRRFPIPSWLYRTL
ncbi:MAG: hypothetical protein GY711_00605 [bacterium]|nr:hypothetical protein [bacterium]